MLPVLESGSPSSFRSYCLHVSIRVYGYIQCTSNAAPRHLPIARKLTFRLFATVIPAVVASTIFHFGAVTHKGVTTRHQGESTIHLYRARSILAEVLGV